MAPAKLCAAEGCGKPVKCAGYCSAHYQRLRKYGRLHLKRSERGSVDKWMIETAVPYQGDDCLKFPFAKDRNGYGHISDRRGTRTSGAHIFIAEAAIGPKPSSRHEVCHTCGNGHLACVNPRHLYWGTRAENVADVKASGTFSPPPRRVGAAHHKARVSEDSVRAMRALFAAGVSTAEVGRQFGIPYPTAYDIKKRKTWRHI